MLRIMLGDLRHRTLGRHSAYIPLSIGFIASYCKKIFLNNIEVKLYDNPDDIIADIKSWRPHIIGLANYIWNTDMNYLVYNYAKSIDNNIICVGGGPEFPISFQEAEKYLKKRPSIDFYCLLEGEIAFSNLISKIINGEELKHIKSQKLHGMVFISPEKNKIMHPEKVERITDLNIIPSPYLSGIFDSYFNDEYIPAIQTARGCPFTCGYCRASNSDYSKIEMFDLERVKDEITYIAKKVSSKTINLLIVDNNFGILSRDIQIAEHIRFAQEKYDWPNSIQADTVNSNYDRTFTIIDIVQNRMQPLCSLQTTNEKTLQVIKRKNLPFDQYRLVQKKLISLGMKPKAELIIPLPLETKKSFLETLQKLYLAGIENIIVFTWILLTGTELASLENRKKYKLKTGYRIMPRQLGIYNGQKCFEIEEICYATSTMRFAEYLECRGYAFLYFLLSRIQYDIIRKIISYFSIENFIFFTRLFEKLKYEKFPFAILFQDFLREIQEEIFPSKDAIYKKYSNQKNYERLIKGEEGDNIFRKYLTKILLDVFSDSLDVIYQTLKELLKDRKDICGDVQALLDATHKWILVSRDFSKIFRDPTAVNEIFNEQFLFDVPKWYNDPQYPIMHYQNIVKFRFYYEKTLINKILVQNKKLFGEDIYYCLGKMLTFYTLDIFWKKYDRRLSKIISERRL